MTTVTNITEAEVKKINKSLNTNLSKNDIFDIIQSNQDLNVRLQQTAKLM